MANNIQLPSESLVSGSASQAAQVEQARAIAEVKAAISVAQAVPRDMGRVEAEVQDMCSKLAVASQAFYSMPRAGGKVEGATVHLARELARAYGNIDYGVRELRRDDDAGESEMQAYAWNQEDNVRATRSFIVPHERMVRKKRTKITDLGDISLNNNNVAARGVRECIFQVMPDYLKDMAEKICRQTIESGEGESLETRVQNMVGAFQSLGVTETMIQKRLGRPRTAWTAGDIRELTTVYGTLNRGEASVNELFQDPSEINVNELTGEIKN